VLVIVFGLLGYLMKKFGFEPGPLVLAFVLGSLMETAVRQSLRIFGGDVMGFVTRPISGTIIGVIILLTVAIPIAKVMLRKRAERKFGVHIKPGESVLGARLAKQAAKEAEAPITALVPTAPQKKRKRDKS
jgi:TctA family transporter